MSTFAESDLASFEQQAFGAFEQAATFARFGQFIHNGAFAAD